MPLSNTGTQDRSSHLVSKWGRENVKLPLAGPTHVHERHAGYYDQNHGVEQPGRSRMSALLGTIMNKKQNVNPGSVLSTIPVWVDVRTHTQTHTHVDSGPTSGSSVDSGAVTHGENIPMTDLSVGFGHKENRMLGGVRGNVGRVSRNGVERILIIGHSDWEN